MLDGISRRSGGVSWNGTAASAPQAAQVNQPAATAVDGFEGTAPATTPAPAPAPAAAQREVTVSDQEVRDQREQVRAEGRAAVAETRQELLDRAALIESHQGDPNYHVEIEQRGDVTIYREQRLDGNRIVGETYLEVGTGQPPEVLLEETRQEGDHWVMERKEAEGGGDRFRQSEHQIHFRDYPGSPSQFPNSYPPPYNPGRIRQTASDFSSDGGNVSKHEQSLELDEHGRVAGSRDAVAEFKERPGGEVDLPGNIDDVLDDGQPVIESRIAISETDPDTGERNVIADEHLWSQGKVRVSERGGGGGPDTFLVERQSEDGLSKDSQLLVKGAQESVRTHTQLNPDGSVTETQELWDTGDGVIGREGDDRPQLLQRTTATRTYGGDGRLATQHKESEDLRTGERRVEDYSRREENGVATYETAQRITDKDGNTTETTVEESALVHADGEQPFSTTIRSGDSTIQISEDSRGRHYTSTDARTGETVRGEVRSSADGGIELEINGKTLQLNADGTFKDEGQLAGLEPEEFSALPFLATGARGIKGIADSLGQDADAVEENVARGLKSGGGEKLKAAGHAIGAALSAYSAFNEIRKGDYLQAALDAAKAGVQGTQFVGSLLGKFEAASKLGKALGVAGSAINIASGVYGIFKADNDFDRATGGLNIVSGGLGIALALTAASGPAAPFLFAGIVGIEILKAFIDHAKSEHVPPLAEGLAG